MNYTSSSSLTLKWNSEKLESFNPTRGLRQGDPMSPYLFVLCMEKLALLIQEKVQAKEWFPVQVSKQGPSISHLFFADDWLLFIQAKASQVRLAKQVLQASCYASGLKINEDKSRFLASKNVPHSKVAKFASISNFRHTYKIGKYLGFPLLSGRVKKVDFTYIVDKINGRLAGWKSKLLNRAGRVTLAKSVISSIPIYIMQNLWLPEGICEKIDSHVRRFIWGNKSIHWVNWEVTSLPKNRGGLGLHSARETNISLLGKHVWSLIHNQDKLWVRMMSDKYLKGGNILSAQPVSGASHIWNSIMKFAAILKTSFITRIGEGEVSLWYDKWLEDDRICNLIPYVDIQDVNLRVCDIYFDDQWHFEQLATLLPADIKMAMQNYIIDGVSEDVVFWENSNSGNYTASHGYCWLTQSNSCLVNTPQNASWTWIWKLILPENIKHFIWITMRESLPTNAFRFSCHVSLDPSCHRCGAAQETILHTSRDCRFSTRI